MLSITFGPVSTFGIGLFLGTLIGIAVTLFDFRKRIFKVSSKK